MVQVSDDGGRYALWSSFAAIVLALAGFTMVKDKGLLSPFGSTPRARTHR
jgi:hypothetical protein